MVLCHYTIYNQSFDLIINIITWGWRHASRIKDKMFSFFCKKSKKTIVSIDWKWSAILTFLQIQNITDQVLQMYIDEEKSYAMCKTDIMWILHIAIV